MKSPSIFLIALASAAVGVSGLAADDVHGINPADMDASVAACQDFNLYGNGGWLKSNPIPSDQSYWGSFTILEEQNRENLHKVLEKVSKASNASGSDDQKVGDFYSTCMDEAAVEAQGLTPLKGELAAIDKVSSVPELQKEIARLQMMGVNAVFNFGSDQDRKNASEVIAGAYQGGLGLPDRDYYLKTDDDSKKLRDEYVAHVTKMFELMGETPAKAAESAKTVMALETKLAQASMTRVERRDTDKTYNRKSLAEIAKLTPNFSWAGYLKELDAPPVAAINVGQPKYFEAFNQELVSTPLADWKTYLRWHLVHAAAPSLSKKFVDETFDFYGKTLQGTPENEVRWKRCVSATDDAIGFALGKAYVRDYFPPEAKARADAMVKNLIAALRADLATLPWMGEATRKAALAKLDTFDPKIGYPVPVARLLRPDDRPRAVRAERPARQRIRVRAGPEEDRQARRQDRVGHVAADGQRVLQPAEERDRVSRRHSAAALLRREGRRRRQLRGDGIGHRSRDDARIRRPGPQVRRPGQHARVVDARGPQELRGALEVRRGPVRLVRLRGPARQRQARPRRSDGGPRRSRDRVPRLPGVARRQDAPRRSTA